MYEPGTTVPRAMLDPRLVTRPDTWCRQCPLCPLVTQGGRPGCDAHLQVVHGMRRIGGDAS